MEPTETIEMKLSTIAMRPSAVPSENVVVVTETTEYGNSVVNYVFGGWKVERK
jgi:hypothetical protein